MVLRKSLPEILKLKNCGRSSDLFLQRCLPIICDSGQDNQWIVAEITATGTVPDSHRIPYYQLPLMKAVTPQLNSKGSTKKYKNKAENEKNHLRLYYCLNLCILQSE